MSYSTGVTERDNLIVRAIQTATACHDPITVESLSGGHLPQDFDLDHDELVGILSNMPPEPEPQALGALVVTEFPDGRPVPKPEFAPKSLEKIGVPHASEAAQPHQDAPQAAPEPMPGGTYVVTDPVAERVMPKIAENEARRALDIANQRLSKARDRMVVARGVLQQHRAALASAIMRWQILGNNLDDKNDATSRSDRQQREIRNHLASTAAERAARAALKIKNNSATRFVQERMENGPSRGAFNRKQSARVGFINHDPRRGSTPEQQNNKSTEPWWNQNRYR